MWKTTIQREYGTGQKKTYLSIDLAEESDWMESSSSKLASWFKKATGLREPAAAAMSARAESGVCTGAVTGVIFIPLKTEWALRLFFFCFFFALVLSPRATAFVFFLLPTTPWVGTSFLFGRGAVDGGVLRGIVVGDEVNNRQKRKKVKLSYERFVNEVPEKHKNIKVRTWSCRIVLLPGWRTLFWNSDCDRLSSTKLTCHLKSA